VNVVALIEAAFIGMLNVALMGVLTPTPVAPLAGTVDTTDGTVTVSWPHPVTKTTKTAASQYLIPNLNLRILIPLLSNRGRQSLRQPRSSGSARSRTE
jgi:hypothetical protein